MNKILKITLLSAITILTLSGFAQDAVIIGAPEEVKESQVESIDDVPYQHNVYVGQDEDQHIRTLFQRNKQDGFYGAVSMGYSPLADENGIIVSARGAWILDHFLAIGLGGTCFGNGIDDLSFIMDDYYNENINYSKTHYAGGYGGLLIEPIIAPMSPVHISFPMLAGFGGIASFTNNYNFYSEMQTFVVFEPSVELEVNVTRFLRIAGFVSYRFTSELNMDESDSHMLNTYSTGITLKFGMF